MRTLLTYLFLVPLFAGAQNYGSIKGTIGEAGSKMTLPGAHVYVEVAGSPVGSATDENGVFHINPLPAGVYVLHISMMGYNDHRQTNVVVKPGQITFLHDLKLSLITRELGPIVITAKSRNPLIDPEEPIKVVALKADIDKLAVNKDVISIVSTVAPGVKEGENGELYFRGARAGSGIYYVDGMRVTKLQNIVPGQSIGSMAVYSGGIPASYGDTTGGVVVIETLSYFELYNRYMAMMLTE